jgi:hypothetical protein
MGGGIKDEMIRLTEKHFGWYLREFTKKFCPGAAGKMFKIPGVTLKVFFT